MAGAALLSRFASGRSELMYTTLDWFERLTMSLPVRLVTMPLITGSTCSTCLTVVSSPPTSEVVVVKSEPVKEVVDVVEVVVCWLYCTMTRAVAVDGRLRSSGAILESSAAAPALSIATTTISVRSFFIEILARTAQEHPDGQIVSY